MVIYAQSGHLMSERRACQVLSIHRSSHRYQPREKQGSKKTQAVIDYSRAYDYWGYRKIADLVRRAGHLVGREQVRLIRRREGLQVPQRPVKRRVGNHSTDKVSRARYPHHVWSWDFIIDRTEDGKTLKFLTVVDEYSKLALVVHGARSMSSEDVKQQLETIMTVWGTPQCIRSDNGSEFIAKSIKQWLSERQVVSHYIDPGSPWQNPFIESFNSILRTTFINRWCFINLRETRRLAAQWKEEYNEIRPHGTLGGLSPLQFLRNFRRDNPN